MVGTEIIWKYFPGLSEGQQQAFLALGDLYVDWNSKINLISRKDIENLYEKHILHSLSIAKWIQFKPGTHVMDLGSGGGFPGIPLAIFFPQVRFHLIDSIGKKIKVIENISAGLGLANVQASHMRAEESKAKYDFVVTRAVADASSLVRWTNKNFSKTHSNQVPNGLIALKGGNVKMEIIELRKKEYVELHTLNKYFTEEFFKEKSLLYIQMA